MCEVYFTYEAAEGNVGCVGHLRVEDTLQFFQNSQFVRDTRFIRCADVHDGDITHDSARGPFQLKIHFQNTQIKLNVAKSRKQLLNYFLCVCYNVWKLSVQFPNRAVCVICAKAVHTTPEAADNSGGKKLQRTDAGCQPYAAAPSPSRCADK